MRRFYGMTPQFWLLLAFTLCDLAFVFTFVKLGYHSRLSVDDFCFVANIRESGYFGAQIRWYEEWTGRWSATAIISLFSLLGIRWWSSFASVVCLFLALIASCQKLLRVIIGKFLASQDLKWDIWLCAIFLACIIYASTPQAPESWLWITGSGTYGWPIAYCIAGIGFLMEQRVISVFKAAFLLALATSSNESLGLLLCSFTAVLVAYFAIERARTGTSKEFTRMVLVFAACAASFLMMALAPGNKIRYSTYNYLPNLALALIDSTKNSFLFTLDLVRSARYWLIALFFTSAILASTWTRVSSRRARLPSLLFLALGVCFLVLAANWILIFPSAYIMGTLPPTRSWSSSSTLIVLTSGFLGALAGMYLRQSPNLMPLKKGAIIMLPLLLFLAAGSRCSLLLRKIPDIEAYSQAVDQRMQYISQMRDMPLAGSSLQLEPLPFTQAYMPAALSPNPSGWTNQCFRRALQLPFHVVVKPK